MWDVLVTEINDPQHFKAFSLSNCSPCFKVIIAL